MNHQIMPTDLHSPSFNRVDKTASQQDNAPSSVPAPKQVHRFSWTRFIGLVTLLALLIGFVSLLSKLVTPQVVTAISILGSFLLLRFVVKVILQITFTLLRYLFWFAVLCLSCSACFDKHSLLSNPKVVISSRDSHFFFFLASREIMALHFRFFIIAPLDAPPRRMLFPLFFRKGSRSL